MKKKLIFVLLATIFIITGCNISGNADLIEIADTILVNGKFYTVNEEKWAEALAIKDGIIIYIGLMKEIESYKGEKTEVIDLNGKFAMPSFVDSHLHPLSNAYAYNFQAALFNLSSHKEYIKVIREFAEKHSEKNGIMGAGFDRYIYDDIGPRKEWLDAIDSKRPIAIIDKDIHTMWVNSKVFEILGWDANTSDPPGGVIVRDPSTGEPSGLLLEMPAMNPAWELFPLPTKQEYKTSLLWISDWLNREGITTAHDAWMEFDPNFYNAYNELANEGKLTVRFRGSWYIDEAGDYLEDINRGLQLSKGFTHPHFKVNSFKFMGDGAGETSLLLGGNSNGIKVWKNEDLVKAFEKVDKAGQQIHAHTIGDGAVKYIIDALKKVEDKNGKRDSRHSLAHVEMARSKDVTRMGELGLFAHITQVLMQQENPNSNTNPHKSLFDAGVKVAIASDFTTSDFKPLLYIYHGLKKSNVSLEQMLRAGTINGAYANFLENEVGSLKVGKKADIVILSKNIFEINKEEIPNVEIKMTFFEGKRVH